MDSGLGATNSDDQDSTASPHEDSLPDGGNSSDAGNPGQTSERDAGGQNSGQAEACSSPGEMKCAGLTVLKCQDGFWNNVGTCPIECTGAGTCTGACDGVSCEAPMCQVAAECEPLTGLCPTPTNAPNGTNCDDGNLCTQSDSCSSGSCVGSNPVVCPEPQQCQAAGVCNPTTGICSAPTNVQDGTNCDDGNLCTVSDSCHSGACTSGSPVTCPAAPQCKVAGTCNPATGNCSTQTNAPNGSTCDDGDPCTLGDSCQNGNCQGSEVSCNSPPACKASTTCSAGSCNYTQNVPDGTLDSNCPSGSPRCSSGTCVECTDDSHCSGTTPSCRPLDHTCVCRLPSSTNLLVNPGFDGSFNGWSSYADCMLTVDSEQCAESNAINVPYNCQPRQCVRVSTGPYVVGGQFKNAGSGSPPPYYFALRYYSDQNCSNEASFNPLASKKAGSTWSTASWSANVPSGVNSVRVEVWGNGVLADQLFFGTSGTF